MTEPELQVRKLTTYLPVSVEALRYAEETAALMREAMREKTPEEQAAARLAWEQRKAEWARDVEWVQTWHRYALSCASEAVRTVLELHEPVSDRDYRLDLRCYGLRGRRHGSRATGVALPDLPCCCAVHRVPGGDGVTEIMERIFFREPAPEGSTFAPGAFDLAIASGATMAVRLSDGEVRIGRVVAALVAEDGLSAEFCVDVLLLDGDGVACDE
jgi:hypothetical protein